MPGFANIEIEKLYEELLADGENTTPTYHEKIMIAKSQDINIDKTKEKRHLFISICLDYFEKKFDLILSRKIKFTFL